MDKEKLYTWLTAHPGAPFSQIEKFFDENGFDWRGNHCIEHGPESNIIFWQNWNHKAVQMIIALAADGRVGLKPVPPLIAFTFGHMPDLPVAKHLSRRYKEPHYCPAVVMCVDKGVTDNA